MKRFIRVMFSGEKKYILFNDGEELSLETFKRKGIFGILN